MDLLLRPAPPWIIQTPESEAAVSAGLHAYAKAQDLQLFTFHGDRCRTFDGFYRQYWDVVRPPMYFGENLDALSETLTDSDVIGPRPVVVLFLKATWLLMDEAFDAREMLLACFADAGACWAAPGGEPAEPPRPFHTVLHLDGPVPAQLHLYPRLEREV